MSNEITIGEVTSAVISYQGQRVCTTLQLSEFYGTEEIRIQQNHNRNLDHFDEGKHFHKVMGDDLRDLRLSLGESQISSMTRSLILWTERGAARHAKMLETDKAWEVFEEMEDRYFRDEAQPLPAAKRRAPAASARRSIQYREAASITRDHLRISKLLGVDTNMARAMAVRDVKRETGIDLAPLLDGNGLADAPMTPEKLGERMGGIKAAQVNLALCAAGLQVQETYRGTKGKLRKKWVVTEAGKEFGGMHPYQSEYSEHSSLRPKWFSRVIGVIEPHLQPRQPIAISEGTNPQGALL